MSSPSPSAIKAWLLDLQSRIVAAVEDVDGKPFLTDSWERPEGGGGVSRLIEEGDVIERGGVNFSHVMGTNLPPSAAAARPELAGRAWEAMGVSLVLHPRNPHAPTVHMNVRFFEATSAGLAPVWWFGGGMDLTPYYGHVDDARHFHQVCHDAVAPYGAALHGRFKKWCDEYFYVKHRKEARGVGGIFFDDFNELPFEEAFALVRAVGDGFIDAYLPILERRKDTPYGERERDFQAYRRGRYVEFNLVWDRGTHFGLQSGGRTEAILMSLPPVVKWRYDWHPEPGSAEAALYTDFLPHRDWLAPVSACIALLGGSFDPVHHGHVALARTFLELLRPDALRVLPARPWQKAQLKASDEERVAMLALAFTDAGLAVTIDRRELALEGPSYTVATLRGLRAELGADTSIVFLMGADQLQRLDSWRDWRELFALANLGIAARPGYRLEQEALPPAVAEELAPRLAPPGHVRATPAGLVCLAHTLAVDISATQVRAALHEDGEAGTGAKAQAKANLNLLVAPVVLDYIQQHNLYKS